MVDIIMEHKEFSVCSLKSCWFYFINVELFRFRYPSSVRD